MKKILIIDDDPSLQDLLRMIFERAGYAVSIESNGNKILNNEYTCPDIFLLDRYLSGVDGLDICRHLKSDIHCNHIPVVMISASPDIATTAFQYGANEFVEKPFEIAELLRTVAKHFPKTVEK